MDGHLYDTIRGALHFIPAHDRELWLRIGMAVKSEIGDEGFALWDKWSQEADNYSERDARTVWKSINVNGGVTIATLYHEAKAHGWRDDGTYRKPTPEELAERQRIAAERAAQDEAEIARARAEAARKAAAIWKAATPACADHPYLLRKLVPPVTTLREIDASAAAAILGYAPKSGDELLSGRLLVAPVKVGDALSTLELIDPDGRKAALAGRGTKAGAYWAAQPLPEGRGDGLTLLIGEGVATVLSAKEASGHPGIAALTDSNLWKVAAAMRECYPAATLVVIADLLKTTGELDPHAVEAARVVGGLLAAPSFTQAEVEAWKASHDGKRPNDVNDMAVLCGIDTVRDAIANAKPPAMGEHGPDTENAPGGGGEGHAGKFDKEAIEKLAKLPPFDYDRAREAEAVRLGVRVPTLDAEVRRIRGEAVEDTGQGQSVVIESPEPWPEPVHGADLLNDIAAIYRRYVVLPEHADVALALWTVHTYGYDYGRCTPILAITSPQKRCGKSTLMSALLAFVNKPLGASNISPSCVYRSIDRWQPTLLIDEADSFLRDNEELRGIINSGHTRELAYVIRAVGDDHEPKKFSTWCPKAIALIGKLPPTLHDRAIVLPLVRKVASEAVGRLKVLDGTDIQRKCTRWVSDHASELREADPVVPPELHDRAADNWRPLLAIADLVGGEWPERARAAAKALSKGDDDAESYAVMLLADIRQMFAVRKTDKLFSEDIVEYLQALEDRPWPQWGRSQKPITKNQVARLLKPFKIKSGTKRQGDETFKGYEHEQFAEPFARYLTPFQTVTPSQSKPGAASQGFQTVTPENNVTDENSPKPASGKDCDGVTDQKGDISQTEAWSRRV